MHHQRPALAAADRRHQPVEHAALGASARQLHHTPPLGARPPGTRPRAAYSHDAIAALGATLGEWTSQWRIRPRPDARQHGDVQKHQCSTRLFHRRKHTCRASPPASKPRSSTVWRCSTGRPAIRRIRLCFCCTVSRPARTCSAISSPNCPTSTTWWLLTTSASATRPRPTVEEFQYSFANLTDVVDGLTKQLDLQRFAIYIQDYGAPIGLSIASRSPERVTAIVSQSGNAYMAGFTPFWDILFAHAKDRAANEEAVRKLLQPKTTRWQYTHGVPADRLDRIAPETWRLDQAGIDRPGNDLVQLQLLWDYQFNLDLYPAFHEYFRTHQPPTLLTWGRFDEIFGPAGARSVPHRPAERRTAPSRRRPLRTRDARRRDRRTDPALPAPTSDVSFTT